MPAKSKKFYRGCSLFVMLVLILLVPCNLAPEAKVVTVNAATKRPQNVKVTYAKSKKAGQFTVKWNKVKCDGYLILYRLHHIDRYMCTEFDYVSKNKNKKTFKLKEPEELKYVNIFVKAFKNVDGKKVYSKKWTKKKKVTIKKFKYKNEPEYGHCVFKKSDCKGWEYKRVALEITKINDSDDKYISYSFRFIYSWNRGEKVKKYVTNKFNNYLINLIENPDKNNEIVFPSIIGETIRYNWYIYLGGGKDLYA